MAENLEAVRKELNEIRTEIREVKTYLLGSPELKGIVTRVTLLEESEERRTFMVRGLWTAIIGLVLNTLADFFRR